MASGRLALGNAKSGRDVDPTLCPHSRLAYRRPTRQKHGAHRTQGIISADDWNVSKQAGYSYIVYKDEEIEARLLVEWGYPQRK